MEYSGSVPTEDYDFYTGSYYYYDMNKTDQDEEDVAGTFLRIFCPLSYSLIFSISLAGNGFLLWVLLRQEGLKRTSSLLLLHLIVSDLMFTIPLPIWAVNAVYSWMMGDVVCKILNGVFSLGTYSYLAFVTAMTVYRYTAVVHAVALASCKLNVHLVCGALWVSCLTFSIPSMMFSQAIQIENGTDEYCIQDIWSDTMVYVVFYADIILFFLLPLAVILFCYSRMWFRIQQCRMARKKKTAKLFLLIVVGFFICWTPYNVFLFLDLLDVHGLFDTLDLHMYNFFFMLTHILACTHCCLSPLIHIFGAGNFRGRLRRSGGFRLRLSVRERTRTLSNTPDSALSAS